MNSDLHSSRKSIESLQLLQLRKLIYELRSNRFYAPRLEAAGMNHHITSLAEYRDRMPFTIKADCVEDQRLHPPYGTNLTYPLDRYSRLHATSGTTAAPLRWLDTPQSWQWMLEHWKCVFRSAGIAAGDRVFFAFSFGPFLGFWTAFESAAQLGLLCIPAGGVSSAARVRMILDNRATVLCCTPTYAIRLAEAAAEAGLNLADSHVRHIIVAGEAGGSIPAVRARIQSLWPGSRVVDHHGMTEVGPVSHECPARPCTLRVIESSYLAEVVDPESLAPVTEGKIGELVLTTLGRLGSPLLRYRTGDLVRPLYLNEAGDAPGHHLSFDGGIVGRSDDMVVVRGVNVYPSAVDQVIRENQAVAEYRVEVDTTGALAEIAVTVEPATDDEHHCRQLSSSLESALRNALSLRIPVRLAPRGSLPRFEMKASRWIRK
jgi:phenylacetate-CoA ligase